MSTLSTRITQLQEQVQDILAGMSQRDRTLLMGLVIAGFIGIVGGSIYTMSSRLETIEAAIRDNEKKLGELRVEAARYAAAKEEAEAIEKELQTNGDAALSAFLDKSAEKVGIGDKLDAVKEKSASNDGVLEEKVYAVSLSEVGQQELAEFLYEIETGGFPLQIQSTKIRVRTRKGEKSLRVDMDISAYRLIEGGEG
ncbi:MAG: hypothetical protein AAFV53_18030 [Myxococcota bacterium]